MTRKLVITDINSGMAYVTADCVVSYKYKIAHSVFSSSEFILNWVIQRDAEYSSPKPESYDVF